MDDYLAKPVTSNSLIEKVAHWARRCPVSAANPEKLLQQVGGGREEFDIVVRTFLENLPTQLTEVRASVETKDAARLEKAAHKLKGALFVMAAETAWCLAEELERLAAEGDLSKAVEVFSQLETEMVRVQGELSKPKVG